MSENDSSDMVPRSIDIGVELINDQITFINVNKFCIDLKIPKLNLGELYKFLFEDIDSQVQITFKPSNEIKQNKKAFAIYSSIKTIVDTAVEDINEQIPDILDAKKHLEEQLAQC